MARLWFWLQKIVGWTRLRHVRRLAIAGVVVCLLDVLVTAWTEHDWLSRLELDAAWRVPLAARMQLFGFSTLAVLGCAVWSLRVFLPRSSQSTLSPPHTSSGTLEIWADRFQRFARRAAWLLMVVIALRAGLEMASQWPQWLLWKQGGVWGTRDPYFHLDLGFWVFRLPFWAHLHATVWKVVGVWWLLCIVLFFGAEIVRLTQRTMETSRVSRANSIEAGQARVWIGALGAMWFVLLALSYGLAIFQDALAVYPAFIAPVESLNRNDIEFSGRMLVPAGYGFTSWWIQRPANIMGALLACAVALSWLGFAASARRSKRGLRKRSAVAWRGTGWVRWLGWGSVAAYVLPGALSWLLSILVQRWIVEPDEAWRERPFLQAHIAMQRLAWKLDTIEEVALRPTPISAVATAAVARDIPPIPLWDEAAFRLRSESASVNSTSANADGGVMTTCVSIDRYGALASREIRAVRVREDRDEVRASRPRDRFEMFSLSRPRSAPQSTLDGIARALQVPRTLLPSAPETTLACGLLARRARLRPEGAAGGVSVRNWVRHAMWAWRLRAPGLLWARTAGEDEPHLWVQRDVLQRAAAIAPFLAPGDVSAVVVENRLLWIVDLLATSKNFPGAVGLQSTAQSTLEGVAGDAVKMVVDAQSGATQLWMASAHSEANPLVRAWSGAFPGLVRPFAEMPQAIRAHRRYPRALLARQLTWLERYHEPNAERAAETWLEREQWWQVARDQASPTLANAAALGSAVGRISNDMAMIDSTGMETRIPSGKASWVQQAGLHARNSSSLMAVLQAGSDGENYGRLQLLRFEAPVPIHTLTPHSLQETDVQSSQAREVVGANELDATQRMKWRLQRGKVLVALMPAKSSTRARPQPALAAHVLMWQPIYRVAMEDGATAQFDVWPLWRVLAGDAMQPQREAGQGATVEQAWRDWAVASKPPGFDLPNESLRRALQWHNQAEIAAKAGDWASADALRQRERKLLQRLLKPRAVVPSNAR